MSNLSHFISQNILLCLVFIFAILVYIVFELRQTKYQRFSLSAQDAINLNNREKGIFLDIRDGKDYNQGHIIGAINSAIANLKSSTKFLNKYKSLPIVIYCDTGTRSTVVYKMLKKDGFDKVYVLKGGFKQWLNNNLPIDKKEDEHEVASKLSKAKK